MFLVSVEEHFDSAHYLRGYGGRCERLHGHRFRVVARVQAARLNEIGLAYDFTELRRYLQETLAQFDHTCLNDVAPFDSINPSSENLAVEVYHRLRNKLPQDSVAIASIEVWESPQSCATYSPDEPG